MDQWQELKDRVAGKWQLPVFLLSLVMLGASLFGLRTDPATLSLDDSVKRLARLVSSEDYAGAIEWSNSLIAREDFADANLGAVFLWAARARFAEARRRGVRRADVGARITEQYESASRFGVAATAADHKQMGYALEWQGMLRPAIESFDRALAEGVDGGLDLQQHVISLWLREFEEYDLAEGLLDQLITSAGESRPDLLLWSIERKLDLYERSGRLEDGTTLLLRHRDRLTSSRFHGDFRYLEAWLLYQIGLYDDAEIHLRTVLNEVEVEDPVFAKAGWLLGRVVLADEGPQRPLEALSFFERVMEHHPEHAFGVASRVGSGDAFAMLGRHAEAVEAYRLAIEAVKDGDFTYPVDRVSLRASLSVLAEDQRQIESLEDAVEYALLAVSLVDPLDPENTSLVLQQLAVLQSSYATALDGRNDDSPHEVDPLPLASSSESRRAFSEAASTYRQLARVNSLNERRQVDASWRAAELYTRAGERLQAGELYQSFVLAHSRHPLAPRALLRLGLLHQLAGRLPEAVESFKQCYRRFPKSLDAARSLVPLARSYLAMGPDYEELAEKTLRIVLEESEVFTPQAPEFSAAMLLQGEVLNRRGDAERAIPTFEEMLERYPDDPRIWRAHFLLADSYRRSGLALKAEVGDAKFADEIVQMRTDAAERFDAAQKLYRKLVNEFEIRDPATLTPVESVYLRHAYLYEADCFFEQQRYTKALKLYEQAAGLYKDTASALGAYVQIINTHVFLGQPGDARAALARALVLVDTLPAEAFLSSVSREGRVDWKRYFEWLGRSELF